jgi:hypothetical protein
MMQGLGDELIHRTRELAEQAHVFSRRIDHPIALILYHAPTSDRGTRCEHTRRSDLDW